MLVEDPKMSRTSEQAAPGEPKQEDHQGPVLDRQCSKMLCKKLKLTIVRAGARTQEAT